MEQVMMAGIERHALAQAQTWQEVFRTICGEQLCAHLGAENPFPVNVIPSKRKADDLTEKEFKVTLCHNFIEATGLHTQLGNKFCAYPFNDFYRVRVRGEAGLINLYRSTIEALKHQFPDWADGFSWTLK